LVAYLVVFFLATEVRQSLSFLSAAMIAAFPIVLMAMASWLSNILTRRVKSRWKKLTLFIAVGTAINIILFLLGYKLLGLATGVLTGDWNAAFYVQDSAAYVTSLSFIVALCFWAATFGVKAINLPD